MKKWKTSKRTIVWRLNTIRCNCYLLKKNNRYLLIDTSTLLDRQKIEYQLKYIGVKNLEAVYITHVHTDHVGNAKYLQDKYHCPVYVQQREYNYLVKGFCIPPKGTSHYASWLNRLMVGTGVFTTFQKVMDVRESREKCPVREFKDTIRILQLPGHTKGSIAIIVDDEIAIVGDTMIHIGKTIFPPFADEPEKLQEAWETLLDTECDWYLPGHGRAVSKRLLQKSI